MQLNKLNNIVFIKKPESNIIEEAFIVLTIIYKYI